MAVLSHKYSNDQEKPIARAAERNYSQLEKEGLAIVYAVKKFHCMAGGSQTTTTYFQGEWYQHVFNAAWALLLGGYD